MADPVSLGHSLEDRKLQASPPGSHRAISKRRNVRSPFFEVAPSFCLPPLERCDGVSPTQAAKSRPS